MNTYLLYGTFICVGLMVVFWIADIFAVMKMDRNSRWLKRGLYASGILAAILNAFRMAVVYESSKGTMIFANVVVIICLLVSYVRMENQFMEKNEK